MSCPSAIGVRSTSIGAPAAIVEASGFIWETSGHTVAAVPTAATAPVATKRKSRRVGWSAEDAVVTIPSPFSSAAGGTAPETLKNTPGRGCRRLRPPRRQKDRLFRPIRRNKQSRIVLLAPLPDERKPAIGSQACNALNPRQAVIIQTFHQHFTSHRHHADCAFPARYPAEHRNDSAPVCVPWRGRPYYRASGLSSLRPPLPPGRHGLSRPCRYYT